MTREPEDGGRGGGVELEAVEGVGRAAVEADGGGVHVDGVSWDGRAWCGGWTGQYSFSLLGVP